MQDFDPPVQQAIDRVQTFETDRGLRGAAARVGSRLDQSRPDLRPAAPDRGRRGRDGRAGAALAPDRVAVFGYAHVPWMKKHQTLLPEDALPGAAERFAQRQTVRDA